MSEEKPGLTVEVVLEDEPETKHRPKRILKKSFLSLRRPSGTKDKNRSAQMDFDQRVPSATDIKPMLQSDRDALFDDLVYDRHVKPNRVSEDSSYEEFSKDGDSYSYSVDITNSSKSSNDTPPPSSPMPILKSDVPVLKPPPNDVAAKATSNEQSAVTSRRKLYLEKATEKRKGTKLGSQRGIQRSVPKTEPFSHERASEPQAHTKASDETENFSPETAFGNQNIYVSNSFRIPEASDKFHPGIIDPNDRLSELSYGSADDAHVEQPVPVKKTRKLTRALNVRSFRKGRHDSEDHEDEKSFKSSKSSKSFRSLSSLRSAGGSLKRALSFRKRRKRRDDDDDDDSHSQASFPSSYSRSRSVASKQSRRSWMSRRKRSSPRKNGTARWSFFGRRKQQSSQETQQKSERTLSMEQEGRSSAPRNQEQHEGLFEFITLSIVELTNDIIGTCYGCTGGRGNGHSND